MTYLLQVDFEMDGPFGDAMAPAFMSLAESINQEPGMLWKIWTEDAQTKQAGGVYLFDTRAHAEQYLEMHSTRLTQAGVRNLRGKIFEVNQTLSAVNKGPVQV